MSGPMLKVLSLGAGVQSSTVALMSAAGKLPPLDAAIFADTGWEPKAVYDWLHEYLIPRLPFPVYIVGKGNLRNEQIEARRRGSKQNAGDDRWASLPYFTKSAEGKIGIIRRQCTSEYKIQPIEKKIRELLGLKPRQKYPKQLSVETWLGISLDETQRMKVSVDAWKTYRHPLVDLRMTRNDCLRWMERNNHPTPPRSSCIGCPFHSDDEWRNLQPEEWRDAVEFDKSIRVSNGMRGETFLHRSCVPLEEVDLSTSEDHGQLVFSWSNECSGVCGI